MKRFQQTKIIAVIALLIGVTLASSCTKLKEGSLYDFSSLQSTTSNQYLGSTGTLYWNVCDSYLSQGQNCGQTETYATFYALNNPNNCNFLTGSDSFSSSDFSFIDSDDHSKGIIISYSNGQTFNQQTLQFVLTVQCDSSVNGNTPVTFNLSNAVYSLIVKSKAGCPTVDLSSIWNFMNDNKWVGMIFLLVFGFFLCFFGLKFIKLTLFLTGFTLGFLLSFIIFEAFLKPDSSSGLNWTAIIVSVLAGFAGAILAFKVQRAGIFAVGALGGMFLAFLIFNTFHFGDQAKYVLWIEVGLCSLIFGTLCVYIKDHVLILASSLVGAYMLVRGISLYPGGFPNEFTVSQEIKNGDWSFPWYYYLYLASIIALKISGAWYQYRARKGRNDSDRSSNTSNDDYKRIKGH